LKHIDRLEGDEWMKRDSEKEGSRLSSIEMRMDGDSIVKFEYGGTDANKRNDMLV
jgi:hypothetical protein